MTPATRPGRVRFGVFVFDQAKRELTKSGVPVKLGSHAGRVLAALLRQPGAVVTREELQRELWPADTYVEFEAGLNSAVRKLRKALGDDADHPIYVETVPRAGYRFTAPVQAAEERDESAEVPFAPPRATRTRLPRLAAAILAIALVAVAAGTLASRFAGGRGRYDGPVRRLTLDIPSEQTLLGGAGRQVAIDPGAQWVAYIARTGKEAIIYRRALSESTARLVPGTEGAIALVISPDSRWIAFTTATAIKEVSVDGRELRELLQSPLAQDAILEWGEGGALFTSWPHRDPAEAGSAIHVLDRGSARLRRLSSRVTDWPYPEFHLPAQLLPGGETLLFGVVGSPSQRSVAALSLKDGRSRIVMNRAMGGEYVPTGHLLYHWGESLYAAPFDPQTLEAEGRGAVVLERVARRGWTGAQASFSPDGTLAYVPAPPREMRELVWVDPSGRETKIPAPPAEYVPLDISRDGNSLLIARQDTAEQWTFWLVDASGRNWTRVAEQWQNDVSALFSPDGKQVALAGSTGENSGLGLSILSVDGKPQSFVDTPYGVHPQQWSTALGGVVALVNPAPRTVVDIALVKGGAAAPRTIVGDAGYQSQAAVSPDGRWLAYVEGAPHTGAVIVRGIGDGAVARIPGLGQGPLWRPDGRALYFRRGDQVLTAPFDPASHRLGSPQVLFEGRYVRNTFWNRRYCMSPDGSRFLFARSLESREPPRRIEVVINWFSEVEKLAGRSRAR
ncbi:MAG: winged helix-turn-helix domain-containing protein [Bryobacteraceae bacterium]|nr:winged helix-turn-helix domain-containing protein [Bryobacteraceae bacterium]